jgi:hypothetical protein
MEAENAATWPNNTQKCYLGSSEGYWQHYTDGNGTCIEPEWGHEKSSVFETSGYTGMAAMDYYYTVPAPIDDDNYGWAEILDFDEYPLEIQCSSCFLYECARPPLCALLVLTMLQAKVQVRLRGQLG